MPAFPHLHFGAHLHCKPEHSLEKIASAYAGGCRRFDGAIRGYGGCPMAKDELVGNLPTEKILSFLFTQKTRSFNQSSTFRVGLQRCVKHLSLVNTPNLVGVK